MDRLRCPIHVAAETGQLAIFRTFVHVDTCSIFASDGQGLKPLNISLRKKQKAITSFLLTKQWTSVTYGTSKQTIPLYLYSKMKKWGDRARDRTIIKHGMTKSSMKVILSLESNFKNIQTLKIIKLSLNSSVWFYPIITVKCSCLVIHLNCCRIPKICEIVLEPQKVCSGDSFGEHGCVCQGKQQGTHDIQTFKRIPGRGDTK